MMFKITDEQRAAIRESLCPYHDSSSSDGLSTGYLRFAPLSTQTFPHGLSIDVRFPAGSGEALERSKDQVTDFLVDALESLLRCEETRRSNDQKASPARPRETAGVRVGDGRDGKDGKDVKEASGCPTGDTDIEEPDRQAEGSPAEQSEGRLEPETELRCIAWCPDECDEGQARTYHGSNTVREIAEQHAEHLYYSQSGTHLECYEVRVRATKGDRSREWDVTVDVDLDVSFSASFAVPRPPRRVAGEGSRQAGAPPTEAAPAETP